jgi:ribosomal protein S18 acetylase RimI-like enzyme
MVSIRPYAPSDAEQVNAVALAAFAQYRGMYDDWEAIERGVGATAALARSARLLVAQEAGRVVGAVAYVPPFGVPRADFFGPEWPIIRMLVVDPTMRGRGIGRALTEQCIEVARRDGAAAIALHTSPAMAVALALYLRMGFRLERQVPDRFGMPYGLYLKPLAAD